MHTNTTRHRRRTAALLTAATVVAALVSTAGSAAARPGGGKPCEPTWQLLDTPTPPTQRPDYKPASVSALAPDNVLFASSVSNDFTATMPWLLRWDGSSVRPADESYPWMDPVWTDVTDMSFDSPEHGWLLANDHWRGYFPHTVQWQDGRWTRVPMDVSPDPEAAYPQMAAITSLALDDAWAVGHLNSGGVTVNGALVQHWDGSRWQVVANPMQQVEWGSLNAVDGVSASEVWAVGRQAIEGTTTMVPLVQRWDGTAWQVVDLPPIAEGSLTAVTAVSATDVWATGWDGREFDLHSRPLVMHYDGTAWTAIDLPEEISTGFASSVYATSPTDVWVTTNTYLHPDTSAASVPGFARWDGRAWSYVPFPGGTDLLRRYYVADIDGTGPGDIWATAESLTSAYPEPTRVLVAHYGCQGRSR